MTAQPARTPHLIAALAAAALALTDARASTLTCRVELDRAVLPADTVNRAVIKVTLDVPALVSPAQRPPVNVALVLDRSGSMSGQKIVRARQAAIEALNRLDGRDTVSVIAFNHQIETLVAARRADDTDGIASSINRIQAAGNTAIFGAVSQAAAELRRPLEEARIHRVILMSDGQANVGPSSPEDFGRLGASLMKEGFAVSTVGLGTDYNEDLMTRLSQNSDGNSYFVASSADLPAIFAAELGQVLNVAVRDVTIEIACPAGVRPLRVIGRDGRLDGRTVTLKLNQLYGGQKKFGLIEVELEPAPARATRPVAAATVTFESALDQTRGKASASASASFSPDRKEVERNVNREVLQDYALNEAALARDRAIELADKGRQEEAARELAKQGESMRQMAADYDMPGLAAPAAALEVQAEDIEKRGLDNVSRKSMRTDSFQMRNQQQ